MSNTQSSFWPMMSIFVYFYLVSVIGSENHCFNLILLPHFVPSSLDHRSLTTINNESTGLRLFSFWLFWPGWSLSGHWYDDYQSWQRFVVGGKAPVFQLTGSLVCTTAVHTSCTQCNVECTPPCTKCKMYTCCFCHGENIKGCIVW